MDKSNVDTCCVWKLCSLTFKITVKEFLTYQLQLMFLFLKEDLNLGTYDIFKYT